MKDWKYFWHVSLIICAMCVQFRYNLFNKTSYEWRWQFSHYSNIKMKYQYCSNIPFIMFWTDIARFLKYSRNLSNSFINILAILQDFNKIFLKYPLNITVLCEKRSVAENCRAYQSLHNSTDNHFKFWYPVTTVQYENVVRPL